MSNIIILVPIGTYRLPIGRLDPTLHNIRNILQFLLLFLTFQPPIELKKRLEEIRLVESRRSARLADSDTDFAKLADMANDRRRSSNSIDVPLTLAQFG